MSQKTSYSSGNKWLTETKKTKTGTKTTKKIVPQTSSQRARQQKKLRG